MVVLSAGIVATTLNLLLPVEQGENFAAPGAGLPRGAAGHEVDVEDGSGSHDEVNSVEEKKQVVH